MSLKYFDFFSVFSHMDEVQETEAVDCLFADYH